MPNPQKSEDEREKRVAYGCSWELRADDPDALPKIVGHVAVFNERTDVGWFKEQIKPGAFRSAITRDDVRATFNHNENYVIGRNTAGTLTLKETERGLYMEAEPPDTQWARDLVASIKRGDISQGSFAFSVIKQSWEENDGEPDLRTIEDVKLYDVAVVTYPAYEGTRVDLRSFDAWKEEKRQKSPEQPVGRMHTYAVKFLRAIRKHKEAHHA